MPPIFYTNFGWVGVIPIIVTGIVLFKMWWYRPHKHVFHRYIMRGHHKEEIAGGKEDVVTHSSHNRKD